jgi:hypothetical protein
MFPFLWVPERSSASVARFSLQLSMDSLPADSLSTDKSKSKLLYDWRFTANQFILASSLLRPTTRDFFNSTLAVIALM